MPYGDRKGPAGFGPRTGRGLGFCNNYDSPGFTNRFSGGMGLGRGYGNNFRGGGGRMQGQRFQESWGQPSVYNQPIDEKTFLNNEIEVLNKNLETMKKRLEEIDKKK